MPLICTARKNKSSGIIRHGNGINEIILVNTKALPYKKFTIINYAFLYPTRDGGLIGVDTLSEAEDIILNGEYDYVKGGHIRGTSLADRAHKYGTKVVASIGGWEGSMEFPQIAADPKKRTKFAHSCIHQILNYRLDGIDIDWESPGLKEHRGTPADKENFTLLLKEIRDSLNALSKYSRKKYLLTAALPSSPSSTAEIEVRKLIPILDFFNIMTYDYYGAWDPTSGHHSPLYASRPADSMRCLDGSFRLYTEQYGVPANKVNLGAAFYGTTYKNCTELYGTHSGRDQENFPDDGFWYYDIVKNLDKFTRHWDEKAQAPYLLGKNFHTFVSYEDEESVRLKAHYILEKNAGGLIIREITCDYMPDGKTPLLDAIYTTFHPVQ